MFVCSEGKVFSGDTCEAVVVQLMMYLYSHRGTLVLVLVWQSPWALYINFILTWYEFVALELYEFMQLCYFCVGVCFELVSQPVSSTLYVCLLLIQVASDWLIRAVKKSCASCCHPGFSVLWTSASAPQYMHNNIHSVILYILNILFVSKEITLLYRRNHRSSFFCTLYLAIQLLSADNTTCACCIASCITCTGTLNKGI